MGRRFGEVVAAGDGEVSIRVLGTSSDNLIFPWPLRTIRKVKSSPF